LSPKLMKKEFENKKMERNFLMKQKSDYFLASFRRDQSHLENKKNQNLSYRLKLIRK
jgi:hypothetical protein